MTSAAEAPTPDPTTTRRSVAAPSVGYAARLLAAVLTAVTVAFVGYAASVVLLFAANGATAKTLTGLASYFALGALITAVVLFIAAVAGLFRHWYWALVSGVVGAPIGVVIGLVIVLTGTPFTGSLWLQIFGSLVSVYFLFWLFVTAAAPLLGTVVWRAVVGSRRVEGPVLLVRLPASTLAKAGPVPIAAPGAAPGSDADAIDAESDVQWDALVGALAEIGATTVEVPVADRAPSSVFLRDVVIVMGQTAILAAGRNRHSELPDLEMRLRSIPVAIEHVDPPAVLSGDDVLVAGSNVYVAVGEHTDAAGVRELRRIAGAQGYTVVALAHVTGRLADAATALPDGTVLADVARLGESARLIPALRPAPEASGASVLVARDDTVLVSDAAPRTRAMLEELGFTVVPVDVSAFESLGGSLGRMAVRLG